MQPLNALRRFWTEPVRAEPLAAFRIAAGLCVACSVIFTIAWDLPLFFTDAGLIPGSTADEVLARTGRFSLLRGPGGMFGSVLDTTWGAALLVTLLLVCLAGLTLGSRARLCAIFAYLILAGFTQRSLTLTNGGDDLAVQALFYLVLAPAAATWALKPSGAIDIARPGVWIAPWSVRLLQIQLCLVYFATALSKVHGPGPHDWLTGEALYWALNDVTLTRWSYLTAPVPLWLCRLGSWGTLAFEFGFPFLIWLPRLRPWLLWAGVGLHLGIFVSMQVGAFSPHMLMFYLLFVRPETLERWRERILSALRPTREAATA